MKFLCVNCRKECIESPVDGVCPTCAKLLKLCQDKCPWCKVAAHSPAVSHRIASGGIGGGTTWIHGYIGKNLLEPEIIECEVQRS